MASNSQLIKETGATFTPVKLADFISEKLISYLNTAERIIKVLDPACGEGVLLSSISRKLCNKNIDHELIGYDSNEEFLRIASENLAQLTSDNSTTLNHADFLEEIHPEVKQTSLFGNSDSKQFINNSIDLIIANPPYVRTQILGSKYAQKIAKKFNLKGRVDLYYPFLLGMTYALKENGLVGVVTSNRYLTTKSGTSVRKFLEENYEIIEVIDLGDTKLFDAAVLPAIFIGRKKTIKQKNQPHFTRIYEELNGHMGSPKSMSNIYDMLDSNDDGFFSVEGKKFKKTTGFIKFKNSKDSSWMLLSNKEDNWINKINKSSKNTIGDLFKVRVGIKTTADKVFIRDDWEALTNTPEIGLLKKLISQENIEPWRILTDKKLKVLYPHYSHNGKKLTIDLDKYPKAKIYFEQHREKLSSRKYLIDAGREWFEIWVPQNPELWDKPKLVFPDISTYPRFYYDESKKIVNGNCYWIVAQSQKEADMLLLIQGISNSRLMAKYHDLMFNNKLYSGRRRYFSQYVEKYPLPDIHSIFSNKIIAVVKKLNDTSIEDKEELIEELEILVAQSFNIEPILIPDYSSK